MKSPNSEWTALTENYPQLADPETWGELSEEFEAQLADAIAEDIAESVTDLDREQGLRVAARLRGFEPRAWSVRSLRLVRLITAACVVPWPFAISADWPGKHLALYGVASAVTFLITCALAAKRAWGSAIAAGALCLLALVDCIAWWRIHDLVRVTGFPRLLARIDVVVYFAIVFAAASLLRARKERLDAPPSRWLYVLFSTYCYGACVFWQLLSTTFKGSGLAETLRGVWDLTAIRDALVSFAASLGITLADVPGFGPKDDGLRFMTWIVWALYGASGTVSLALMVRKDTFRAAIRWLLVPCSLYAWMGPWLADSWQWFRYLFLLLPIAALFDWRRSRKQQQPESN